MEKENLKKNILEELKDIQGETITTTYLCKKYKISLSLSEEIKREYEFINSNCQKFGYARISTKEQNEGRQIEIFKNLRFYAKIIKKR